MSAPIALPIANWCGRLGLAQLFAVALLAGAGQMLFSCAYSSFFVTLVDRDQYVDANSTLSTSRSASFVVGPAAGGFLIQALTAPVAIVIDAVSFPASALFIGRITAAPIPVDRRPSPATDVGAGPRYVLGHSYLRAASDPGCHPKPATCLTTRKPASSPPPRVWPSPPYDRWRVSPARSTFSHGEPS